MDDWLAEFRIDPLLCQHFNGSKSEAIIKGNCKFLPLLMGKKKSISGLIQFDVSWQRSAWKNVRLRLIALRYGARGDDDRCGGRVDNFREVLGEAAVAIKPSQCALDQPAAGKDDETLGCGIAKRSAAFRGSGALAVDHCGAGRCLPAYRLVPDQQQGMAQREQQPVVAPQVEPAPHRPLARAPTV
jgi:hypothetical protein